MPDGFFNKWDEMREPLAYFYWPLWWVDQALWHEDDWRPAPPAPFIQGKVVVASPSVFERPVVVEKEGEVEHLHFRICDANNRHFTIRMSRDDSGVLRRSPIHITAVSEESNTVIVANHADFNARVWDWIEEPEQPAAPLPSEGAPPEGR